MPHVPGKPIRVNTPRGRFLFLETRPGGHEYEKGVVVPHGYIQEQARQAIRNFGPIDSTENVGNEFGVHSREPDGTFETQGYVLTADGEGGSTWARQGAAGSLADMIRNHDDLLAFWPLDDASGDAHDEGPHNIPLSTVGTPTYGSDGPFDDSDQTSILFDGVDGFNLTTDDHFISSDTTLDSFDGTLPFSMEILLLPSSLSQSGVMMTWTGSAGQIGLGMGGAGGAGSGGMPWFNRVGTTGYTLASETLLDTTNWWHVVGTYDGATMCIYINGELIDDLTAGNIGAVSGDFRLARIGQAGATNNYFKGNLAYAAVYTAALTADEVADHAAAGAAILTEAEDIRFTPSLTIAATNVQDAIVELANEAVLESVIDAKGDLIAGTAADTVGRLAVGTDDQVLVAASAQSTGLAYQSRIKSLSKSGSTQLTGDVFLVQGSNVTLTQSSQSITVAATVVGSGAVDSIAEEGSTPLTGAVVLTGSTGMTLTQTAQSIAFTSTASEWFTTTTKGSSQNVVDSTTFVDCTDLVFAIGSSTEYWYAEYYIPYASSAATDLKWEITAPGGGMIGWFAYKAYSNTAGSGIQVSTGTQLAAVTTTGTISIGGNPGVLKIELMFRASGTAGNVQFRFANASSGTGTSTIIGGSTLRTKKIA